MNRLARLVLTGLFALLMAATAVTADDGYLVGTALQFDAEAHHDGELAMFYANDLGVGEAGHSAATGSQPWIDFQAGAIDAVLFEDTATFVTVPGTPLSGPVPGTVTPTERPSSFGESRAHLTAFQPGFEVHVFSPDGTIAYHSTTHAGRVDARDDAVMSAGSFGADPLSAPSNASNTFTALDRPGPWVLAYDLAPATSIVLEGDFVVELTGITLEVDDGSGPQTLESGVWYTPADPNAPPASQAVASKETRRFLRLTLTSALLEFATESGAPKLGLAAGNLRGTFGGDVAVVDASGAMETASGRADLSHERYVIAANSFLTVLPQADQRLGIDVAPAPASTHPSTLASVPAPASAALIGTGAVLALAIAIGIGVLRRVLRLPALADVERAIEEGEYRKAARLAARILSRLPGSEEAILGRAIALSKAGRPRDVVTELTRHLELRPASDGTLHYVLGLAQLDAGDEAAGQASLREAVRLTPSLQAEVAPRLGKAFSVAPTTTKETHGYA